MMLALDERKEVGQAADASRSERDLLGAVRFVDVRKLVVGSFPAENCRPRLAIDSSLAEKAAEAADDIACSRAPRAPEAAPVWVLGSQVFADAGVESAYCLEDRRHALAAG